MAGYPKHTRRKFFAMKYIRLLLDKRIIEKLGHSVFALLVQVVIREDHLKYAPVNFSNDDLRDRIGVSKEDTMARARDRAVQEGWLFYRPAPVGSRRSGTYWVTLPSGYSIDMPIEKGEPADEYEQGYRQGLADGKQDANRPHPEGESDSSQPPMNGCREGFEQPPMNGCRTGGRMGVLLDLVPIPSSPNTPKAKKRQPAFTPEDRATAEFILDRILDFLPTFRKPNLDQWANDVRLMRDQDHRTDEQIRHVFTLANEHVGDTRFSWRNVILSPSKLRKQFDTLQAKLDKPQTEQPYQVIRREKKA